MADAVVAQISSVAAAANVADKVVRKYTHALSGFAVSGPTPDQLRALVEDPNVVAIWPSRFYRTVSACRRQYGPDSMSTHLQSVSLFAGEQCAAAAQQQTVGCSAAALDGTGRACRWWGGVGQGEVCLGMSSFLSSRTARR